MKSCDWCMESRRASAARVDKVVKELSAKFELLDPVPRFRSYFYESSKSPEFSEHRLEFSCPLLRNTPKTLKWTDNQIVLRGVVFNHYQILVYPDLVLLLAYFVQIDDQQSILILIGSNKKEDNEVEIRVHEGQGRIDFLRFNHHDIPIFDGFAHLLFPEIPHILRICLDIESKDDVFSVANLTTYDDFFVNRIKEKICSSSIIDHISADKCIGAIHEDGWQSSDVKATFLSSKIRFFDWINLFGKTHEPEHRACRIKNLIPPETFLNGMSSKVSLALAGFLVSIAEAYSKDGQFDNAGIGAPTEWTNKHWILIYSYLATASNNQIRCRLASNVIVKFFKEPLFCYICRENFDNDHTTMMVGVSCKHMMCPDCFQNWTIRSINTHLRDQAFVIENAKCALCQVICTTFQTTIFKKSTVFESFTVIDISE